MVELKIAVGSINPVKVGAVVSVARRVFGGDVVVVPVEVDSGVPPTPIGEDVIVRGAVNRAFSAFKLVGDADLAVGMEGGLVEKFGRWFITGWCAVVDSSGSYTLGSSVYMEVPRNVVDRVFMGVELGDVIDEISGLRGTKRSIGAIGVFTRRFLTRGIAWENALIYALVRVLNPGLFA